MYLNKIPAQYHKRIQGLLDNAADMLNAGKTVTPALHVGNLATGCELAFELDTRCDSTRQASIQRARAFAVHLQADYACLLGETWTTPDGGSGREAALGLAGDSLMPPAGAQACLALSIEMREGWVHTVTASIRPASTRVIRRLGARQLGEPTVLEGGSLGLGIGLWSVLPAKTVQ